MIVLISPFKQELTYLFGLFGIQERSEVIECVVQFFDIYDRFDAIDSNINCNVTFEKVFQNACFKAFKYKKFKNIVILIKINQ